MSMDTERHRIASAARDGAEPPVRGALRDLLPALRRLDGLLTRAVARARAAYGDGAVHDRFRGLYVGEDDVDRLLEREPGEPVLFAAEDPREGEEPQPRAHSWLVRLAEAHGLSAFDVNVLVVALAPEIDLRYERLYAYLQDDVTRRRPSVDLALDLLCASADERLVRRNHFAADAPLLRHRLLDLIADGSTPAPTLLGHQLRVPEQIACLLLGQDTRVGGIARVCRYVESPLALGEMPIAAGTRRRLLVMVRRARADGSPLRVRFRGASGTGKRTTAAALAAAAGAPLLAIDVARLPEPLDEAERLLHAALREAWLHDAIAYVHDDGDGRDGMAAHGMAIRTAIAAHRGVTIVADASAAGGSGWIADTVVVPFTVPDAAGRGAIWRGSLRRITAGPDEAGAGASGAGERDAVGALASRFALTPRQIDAAVRDAVARAAWRSGASPTAEELFAAARAQSGHDLAALASRIEPRHRWRDIVLPPDALAQLREICQRVAHRHHVMGRWGFAARSSRGRGLGALFAGSSGTGKTMAAEIIAAELGVDLYRVDLAGVVSKYIGETEKNLDRVFAAAEHSNGILFFDEADALFGKRSEVRDSHDRYANVEIGYLLQKMEEYEGVAILATNLRGNLDDAFVRRLAFTVHFPFPDEAHRRRIWRIVWPGETPVAADVDAEFLARAFKLSGGNIANVALAAAFLAAEDGGAVTMAHLLRATRREYQKLGRQLVDDDVAPYTLDDPT